jgi:hypothetical protein
LKGKELENEEIFIPQTQVSFPKATYIRNSKDMTDVPTQDLGTIGINTLEKDNSMVDLSRC